MAGLIKLCGLGQMHALIQYGEYWTVITNSGPTPLKARFQVKEALNEGHEKIKSPLNR